MKQYEDRQFLYEMYVKKRLNLKDIQKILAESYMEKVSIQTLYNWVAKYDLLKFRGKGRNLKANMMGAKQSKPHMQLVAEQRRREHAKMQNAKMQQAKRRSHGA